jgi:Mg/Co/Ni transporter MgtE
MNDAISDDIRNVEGRTAASVVHPQLTSLPSSVTVAEVRAYFAASPSRRLATLLDDDGRYVAALAPEDLPPAGAADEDEQAPARACVREARPTIRDDAPAADARDLALATPTQRVSVLDADGRLVGVVAIDKTRTRFCGLGEAH